jgi:hypothetical protein
MTKILFITSSTSDYLADSLFHGFRSLYGSDVIDYPKADIMYNTFDSNTLKQLHGKGFTCYGLLEDIPIDRYNIIDKVKDGYYSLIIFSSIHRQFGFFSQLYPWLNSKNTIIVDGEDYPTIFKYNGNYFRNFHYNLLPNAHKNFTYFKREWSIDLIYYLYFKIVPKFLIKYFNYPKNLKKISFSIPELKIENKFPVKTKLFASHIVDPEVKNKVIGTSTTHIFDNEQEYYNDLMASKFAITTKRAGWDCIRHYEIAANRCVMCFKELNIKPSESAPHDLNITNCIIYKDYDDLMMQINLITDDEYLKLQENSYTWIKTKTTINVVKYLLEQHNIIDDKE